MSRIFAGATKPPMFLGVPMRAFLLLAAASSLLCGALMIFVSWIGAAMVLMLATACLLWMRDASRRDPWRFHQVLLRIRLRHRQGNTQRHGGISFAPYQLIRRQR